jgi:hypothetical protein
VLDGHRCRVTGRAVFGVSQGETYSWNEFRLVDDSGDLATLVHEETEDGPTWQLFLPFTPVRPIPAYEAEVKFVGQTMELEGVLATIKFKGKSVLHFLEGERSDNERVGDVASYFNAESDNREFVVSWTGDKVECYRGKNLSAAKVAEAFGLPLPQPSLSSRLFGEDTSRRNSRIVGVISWIIIAAVFVFARVGGGSDASDREIAPPVKQTTHAPAIALQQPGTIDHDIFTPVGRTELEIAGVDRTYGLDEFNLIGADRRPAILLPALDAQPHDWFLLRALDSSDDLTPYAAAEKHKGGTVSIDGHVFTITRLVRFKALSTAGKPESLLPVGAFEYGLIARTQDQWLLVRWNETHLELFSGHPVPEQEILAAFQR